MTKVDRVLIADGDWFCIECAVRSDLSSPVVTFLDDMAAGVSQEGAQDGLTPDEQVDWRDWFIRMCARIANEGVPPYRTAFNQLQNGIWEFKHGGLRVSFYDTDGSGDYTPLIDTTQLGYYGSFEWPDDFEEVLRLATAFQKDDQQAHVTLAQEVREEDLEHDRRAQEPAIAGA